MQFFFDRQLTNKLCTRHECKHSSTLTIFNFLHYSRLFPPPIQQEIYLIMTSFDMTFTNNTDNNNNSLHKKKIVVGGAIALLLGIASYSLNGTTISPDDISTPEKAILQKISNPLTILWLMVYEAFLSSKSAPPLLVDLPPPCEGLGDPVYTDSSAVPQVFPSEFVRTYTADTDAYAVERFVVVNTAGTVDADLNIPTSRPNNTFPGAATWRNAEGGNSFRLTMRGSCLQDITDDYYYLKVVFTAAIPRGLPGICRLVRVSRNTPGTWKEYETQETVDDTAGGAVEWAYDAEPKGKRIKFSLCPDNVDKNAYEVVSTTFG